MADRLRMHSAPPRALLSVRLVAGSATHWIGEALGVHWQTGLRRRYRQGAIGWWSGAPDQWWIDAPADQGEALARALEAAMPPGEAMVTEVSDAWVTFHLAGTTGALRDFFERAGPVGAQVLNGDCLATRFGAFAVTLFEVEAGAADPPSPVRRIELRVERPLAKSFEQWLAGLGAVPGA